MLRLQMSYLTINGGIKISYALLDGDSGKPFLVFLHEGLGCVEKWKEFPEQLCKVTGCSGLLYDRRGYGRSSALTEARNIDYLHDYALIELPQVVESLIPRRDYILVGHSDGASIALIHGAKSFPRLKGLVLEAPHVFVEERTIRGIRRADEKYDRNGPGGLRTYHGDKTHAVFKSWSATWLSGWFRAWNIEALLPYITCPTLLIQGENDEYGTEEQVDAITRQIGSKTVVSRLLKGCGHTPHREQPELLMALVKRFLLGLTSSR